MHVWLGKILSPFLHRVSAQAAAFQYKHEAVCWNGPKAAIYTYSEIVTAVVHWWIFLLQQISKRQEKFWLLLTLQLFFFSADNCYPRGLSQGLSSPKQRLGFFWNVQNAARPPWWSSADWLNWHKSLACMSQQQRRKTYRPVFKWKLRIQGCDFISFLTCVHMMKEPLVEEMSRRYLAWPWPCFILSVTSYFTVPHKSKSKGASEKRL